MFLYTFFYIYLLLVVDGVADGFSVVDGGFWLVVRTLLNAVELQGRKCYVP